MAKQEKCEKAMQEIASAVNKMFAYEEEAKKKTSEQIIEEGREASQRVHEWMVERNQKRNN